MRAIWLKVSFFSILAIILALQGADAAGAMSFEAVRIGGSDAVAIAATGQITESTPEEFRDFLLRNNGGRRPIVFIDSPGGRVLASMEFGALLRKVGAEAIIARIASDGAGRAAIMRAGCFSACVYAFMGASKRVVPSNSQIGIHRMFAYRDEMDSSGTMVVRHRRYDNGEMRAFLMRYSSEMGISPGLIAAAEHISPDTIKVLSQSEIRRWHLAVSRR